MTPLALPYSVAVGDSTIGRTHQNALECLSQAHKLSLNINIAERSNVSSQIPRKRAFCLTLHAAGNACRVSSQGTCSVPTIPDRDTRCCVSHRPRHLPAHLLTLLDLLDLPAHHPPWHAHHPLRPLASNNLLKTPAAAGPSDLRLPQPYSESDPTVFFEVLVINCSNRLFKLLNQTGCTLLALPAPTHRLTELNSQRSCALLAALEAALPVRSATRCHNAHWPAAGVPGEKPADLGTGDHSRALFTPTREALSHSARRASLEARTLGSRWPSPAPPPSLDGCLVCIATARFRR